MPSVYVIQGEDKGQTFELPAEDCTLGRGSGAVRLTDTTVSRNHAKLICQGSQYYLEDLGSSNGTAINGNKVKESVVRAGDRLRLGRLRVQVEGPGGAAAPVD